MLRTSLRVLRYEAPYRHCPGTAKRLSRNYASVTDLGQYPSVGDKLHGFTLRRTKHFPELELSALHFSHDRTGAEHLHIARDDSNNVFSIGFKTNPPDATGVPHILEHTALCGSERYPVRDPFFKMLPRSLSNFMNAFTSSDHTTYPFATTNLQDFRNLMSVYLDATLHPLLNKNDFSQEGWRIGPENPRAGSGGSGPDKEGKELVFKGVVYNEMKGQMSDASYLYYIRFHEHIVPALNNSGGDPQKITDLTHEQLKRFHSQHYHPSNAKIFSYGDFPIADHLSKIDSRLKAFQQIPVDQDIKEPISLRDGSRSITIKGPVDPLVAPNAQYKTSVSWLMGDASNVLERFSLSFLSALLIDGYGSPLYRDLIEAGLGSDFTPNTGFDSSTRMPIFSVGLTGVTEENVHAVREAILSSLKRARGSGFAQDKVDGFLHQLELGLKHKTANFGMGLMQRLQPDWFNGLDPFNALGWQEVVTAFKAKQAEGGYLEGLMDKYLLSAETLTFTMEPSETYGADLAEEEAQRLSMKISEVENQFASKAEAYEHMANRELELLKEQEGAAKQDLSCLPTLHVNDIPRQKPKKDLRFSSSDGIKVQWREAPTNGLTYFRAIQPIANLPAELRVMVPLFTEAVMRLGTKEYSIERLEELMRLRTGGISIGYHLVGLPDALDKYEEGFSLSGNAFDKNVPAMYELLQTLIRETNFEGAEAEGKVRELLQASANGAMDAIASRGHSYARRYAEASLSLPGYLREQSSGLTQVKLTAGLAARPATESLQDVLAKLKAIQQLVIQDRTGLRVALTCSSESIGSNEQALEKFLAAIPVGNHSGTDQRDVSFGSLGKKTFFDMPYQVSYVGSALPTVPYSSPEGGRLQVLSQLLTHKHLHREIREKGGAYGGGAYAQGLAGVFGFYSYRDPNPQNTLDVIRTAGEWARDRNWTDEELGEAKLSIFQGIDAPESVSDEGMTQFVYGVDHAMAQRRREQLLDVTSDDVRRAAQKFLIDAAGSASLAVLGPRRDWVKEADGWTTGDLGLVQQKLEGEADRAGDEAQSAAAASA